MTVSLWQETAQPREAISHDVVVVGAGIVGSYAAHVLTERGRDVALVERRFPASGASGRNAGLVLVGTRDYYVEAIERFGRDEAREIWALTVDNVARMRALSKEYGVEHQETGASYLAFDDPVADQLAESAKLLERDGFQAEYVDKDPLGRGFRAALNQPTDFSTNPAHLTQAIARTSGATIYENDEVFDIARNGGHLVVHSRLHEFHCEKVFLALNGYIGLFYPRYRDLVKPARGQILVTGPAPKMIETTGLSHKATYFRQEPDGRFMIGGGRFQFEDEEYTWSDRVTPNIQGYLEDFVKEFFPEASAGVTRRWAGIHGMTPDGLPIMGSLRDESEVYFCVGFSGHGNSLGLIAAERTVDVMLDGASPGVFDVGRFE